jgi:hypothetical protein
MDRALRLLATAALVIAVITMVVGAFFFDVYVSRPGLLDEGFGRIVAVSWPLLNRTGFLLCLVSGVVALVMASERRQWGWLAGLLVLLLLGAYAIPLLETNLAGLLLVVLNHSPRWFQAVPDVVFALPVVVGVLLYTFTTRRPSRASS